MILLTAHGVVLIIARSAAETAKAIMHTYASKNRNTCFAKAQSRLANHGKKKVRNSRRLPAEIQQEIEELSFTGPKSGL
jgi:hypothetical protein